MLCCYLKTSYLLETNLTLILPGIQGNTASCLLGQSGPRLLCVPVPAQPSRAQYRNSASSDSWTCGVLEMEHFDFVQTCVLLS